MTYTTPKTYFNETEMAYFASLTVCVQLDISCEGEREGGEKGRGGKRERGERGGKGEGERRVE